VSKIHFTWCGHSVLPEGIDWVDESCEGFVENGLVINWGSVFSFHLSEEKITHTLFVASHGIYFSNNVPPDQVFEISLLQEGGTEIGSCGTRYFKLRNFSKCAVYLPAGKLLLEVVRD